MLAASPPPAHPPFTGCSSSHQLPQLGSLQLILCSGSDAEITSSHLQGPQLLSQASTYLGGIEKHSKRKERSQESPQQQARGTRQLTTNIIALSLVPSSPDAKTPPIRSPHVLGTQAPLNRATMS